MTKRATFEKQKKKEAWPGEIFKKNLTKEKEK
jgi:hypothetical protein